MSEENFCVLGKVPKVFSYVKDGKYFHTVCKLRDDVDGFKLNEFFNMVYSLKLDIWDAIFFNGNYSTGDLIRIFRLILKEDKFINLKDLCCLMGNRDDSCNHPVIAVVKYFFDMFETIDFRLVPLNDSKGIKLIAMNSDDMFYKEVESIFYNSSVMDFLSDSGYVRVRKQS